MPLVKKLIISLIAVLGFVIYGYNFYVAHSTKYNFGGDASDFIHLGLTLAKTGKYGHLDLSHKELVAGFKSGGHSDQTYEFAGHSTWRPPVWPAIIALCFLISGYSISFLIIVKFLLHLLGAWFFYKTLGYFRIRRLLMYAGVFLYFVSPAWQLYSRVFLSEPITLFFMTLFLWSLVRYLNTGKLFWLNGLLGGILILSHPYYLFLPFSIWLFLLLFKRIDFKRIFILSVISVAVVSIWIVRNCILLETDKLLITTSSGAVMAKGWNNKVPELHTNTKGDLADETLVLKDFDYKKSDYTGPTGMMQLYQDATYSFIKTNPEMIWPIISKKLQSAFNPFPETPRPGILETGRVIFQVLALFAAIFIILLGKGTTRALVLGLFFSTILISIITYSGFRFRMPQSSLEIFFLAVAIHFLIKKYGTAQIKP